MALSQLRGGLTPQHVRYRDSKFQKFTAISESGWHLSHFGGVRQIQEKIESCAAQNHNVMEVKSTQHLREMIESGMDLYGRDAPHGVLGPNPDTDDLPELVRNSLVPTSVQRTASLTGARD